MASNPSGPGHEANRHWPQGPQHHHSWSFPAASRLATKGSRAKIKVLGLKRPGPETGRPKGQNHDQPGCLFFCGEPWTSRWATDSLYDDAEGPRACRSLFLVALADMQQLYASLRGPNGAQDLLPMMLRITPSGPGPGLHLLSAGLVLLHLLQY